MQLLQESVAFMVPKTAVAAVTAAARGETLSHCVTYCKPLCSNHPIALVYQQLAA
jgi:hypothetical protein